MSKTIDINVDVGEGFGIESQIFPFISSANIACGGHAGDYNSMHEAVELAKKFNVRIGAHPGFEDKENFGRKPLDISLENLKQSIVCQIQRLIDIAHKHHISVRYLKAHGALYHLVCHEECYARLLIEIIHQDFPELKIMGLPNCLLRDLCLKDRVEYIAEGFADRSYEADGKLMDRNLQGSMLEQKERIVEQVINFLFKKVKTIEGNELRLVVNSICFHGDSKGAIKSIQATIQELKSRGIEIQC